MLVAGAKRHAKEVLQVLEANQESSNINFFDDVSTDLENLFFNNYKILSDLRDAKKYFEEVDVLSVQMFWVTRCLGYVSVVGG